MTTPEQIEPGDLCRYVGGAHLPAGTIRRCTGVEARAGICNVCGVVPDGLLMSEPLPAWTGGIALGWCRCGWRKLCGDPSALIETKEREREPA